MLLFRTVFEWVDTFESSIAIRESLYVYPYLLVAHVVGMCLFVGTVAMMDLRLAGWGNNSSPLSQVQAKLFPWQVLGLVLSGITGMVLLYGQPMRYYGNIFFWVKMVMMALAAVNAMIFHRTAYRSIAAWDTDARPPLGARVAGASSLFLWGAVIICGRLIAYNWFE
jgi:hypothetical protein